MVFLKIQEIHPLSIDIKVKTGWKRIILTSIQSKKFKIHLTPRLTSKQV